MTRSTRLLAVGITVLVAALVLLLVAQRSEPDPIVVADDTSDVAASATEDEGAAAPDTGTVGALAEDAARLPMPLEVPTGHEAVAVTSTYDAAVAGLPVPGDRVNLYAVFQQGVPDALATDAGASGEAAANAGKGAIRTLSGVEVLGVTGVEPQTGGGSVTLVLALEPADAERTIYLAAAEQVWFSLVAPDHTPVDGAGVTRETVLDDLS